MDTTLEESSHVLLRPPLVEDAPRVYRLITECKPLDVNSEYLYMILCLHFGDTCAVASLENEIVGAATAYVPPARPDTLFVWQIAVARKVRKLGLGGAMLGHLLKRRSCERVEYLEASVTPSNRGSFRLFQAFAREIGAPLHRGPFLAKELFLDSGHEEEDLIRIGPIQREVKS